MKKKNSEMRAWLNSEIKPLIPSEVKNNIKTVVKYTTSSDVFADPVLNEITKDDVWIPSYGEIHIPPNNAGLTEESKGPRYSELFASDDDWIKIIKSSNDLESSWYWWLRSTKGEDGVLLHPDGAWAADACAEGGVALGFCL